MSAGSIQDFIEKAQGDSELQSALQATKGDKEAICRLAVGHGFSVTLEDLEVFASSGELNEEDLDNISGGVGTQAGISALMSALRARSSDNT